MSARSAQPEVRNPVLALEATQQLLALPPESRAALAAVLEELATQAHAKAEVSWRQRKGPMAAYWRAVGVYARHTARATRRGNPAPQPRATAVVAAPLAHQAHRRDGSCHPERGLAHVLVEAADRRARIRAMPDSPAKYAAMVREGMA